MHSFKVGDKVTIKAGQEIDALRGLKLPFTITHVPHGFGYLPAPNAMIDVVDGNGVARSGVFARRFELLDDLKVLQNNAHLGLIDHIKAYRAATGATLMDAKRAVEAYRAKRPSVDLSGSPFSAARYSTKVTATVPFDKPLRKHWFIAVLNKDNEPQPNSPPKLYTSAEQARAVAYSMAEKHRGETFVVYEATDVVLAPHVRLPETQSHKL